MFVFVVDSFFEKLIVLKEDKETNVAIELLLESIGKRYEKNRKKKKLKKRH